MQYRALFIGLTTIDIQYFVDEYPEQNTKVKTTAPDILVGGPAANAAVAFSKLNGGVHLATIVGDNSFTSFIESDFQATNINLFDLAKSQKIYPIVASVVTSANGDRNIFTHNPSVIKSTIAAESLFEEIRPQILMLDGFYPEFSIECAKLAKAKDIPVVIDGGSWKPQYNELLKYTDIAICSADFYPPNCKSSNDVFDFIEDLGVDKIAVSRGEQSILIRETKQAAEIEIESVNVVDTLGAGDFLHGAFCYYFMRENSFSSALNLASKLSSYSCTYKGTRNWLNNYN